MYNPIKKAKNIIGIFIFFILVLPNLSYGEWEYDWGVRTDRDGKSAGIYDETPFPIVNGSTSYSITNDEGTTTYNLGTIYYVDNNAGSCSDGSTNYNPNTRTCGTGSKTVYTSLTNALSAAGNGNKTILVRGGTYTGAYSLSGHYGIDNTHRFSIIGYGQERPVFDGNNSKSVIFGLTGQTNDFVTLQRITIQNNKERAVRIGNQTSGADHYFDMIDVEVYNCANDTKTLSVDGNIYYLNADNGWLFHVTSYHTMGHCIKIGDGASSTIVEWTKAYECGYWSTMVNEQAITNWASSPGTHPSGIDFPNDAGVTVTDNIVRYNIVYDTLYYGMQFRNTQETSVHHNEIYNTPHFDDVPGVKTGATGSPQLLILGLGSSATDSPSGDFYSNVIYDASDASSSGIAINSLRDGYQVNVFNNLIYNNPLGEIFLYGYMGNAGTSRKVNIYNNTLYHNAASYAVIEGGSSWAAGEVTIKNNIMYQAGTGKAINLDTDILLDHNLYYYPNGTLGAGKVGTNDLGKTGNGINPLFISIPSKIYSVEKGALSGQSPALCVGENLSQTFTSSLNGITREIWDIGAYQLADDQKSTELPVSPINLHIE